MTIQPSIIVWTVLCFAALYLILKNLLFEPMLKLMDQRTEKIEHARQAGDEARKIREEKRQLALAEEERRAQEIRALREQRAEQLRLEGKEKLEDAKAERFARVEAYRRKTDAEFEEDMKAAGARTEKAAELFLSRLF